MARFTARLVLLCTIWLTMPSWGRGQDPQVRSLWEQGQAAMKRGDHTHAIELFQQCLARDTSFARAHLSLAAAYLEEGVERNAVPHLAIYMRAVPEHVAVRVHYAEILFHLQMFQESRTQFEQCIAHAQDRVEIAPTLHIEIHSKLMEIAEILEDDYAEHLERGIGLYLLAGERSRLADPDGKLSVEGLLCRAVGELKEASSQRPKEARPQWYLYLTSIRLGQRPQAERALRETERRAKFSELTPCEEDELELTRRKADTSAKHR